MTGVTTTPSDIVMSPPDPFEEMYREMAPVSASPAVPHSREAEEAVVGAVLIDPDCYYTVSQFLKAEDFHIHRNRWIWEAYGRLFAARTPIDLLTLCGDLEKAGQLDEIGGSAHLTSLVTCVPTSLHAESYGRIVEENSIRRRMIASANTIASLAYDGGDIYANYAKARKSIDSAVPVQGAFTPIQELVTAHYDRIDARSKGVDEHLVPTGFADLDHMLDGGLRPADLTYIGGRPGMGKTGIMLDIADYNARSGRRVGIFSLEMSNEQVTDRLIVKRGIPMKAIRTGHLAERDWPIYTAAVEEIHGSYRLYLNDVPALNPVAIRAQAHTLYNTVGLDLLIVDYVQLMGSDDGSNRNSNRNNELSTISRNLKVTARELGIPILCGAQLSRALESRSDRRPVLSDLRDSGSLEADADIVIFLYRDEIYGKTDKAGIAEVIVSKQRNGPTGTVELVFRAPLMKFENAATKRFAPNESPAWQTRTDIGDD